MAKARKHPPIPVIILVVALLAGAGGWWWWSSTQPNPSTTGLDFTGAVESNQYQVGSALAGRITAVKVSEGDQVTKGQPLVELDAAAFTLQKQQAQQGVVAAKAALTNAKNDDDSTKADITAAKARLSQAEAAVKLADVQLGYTKIAAPRSGVVISVTANTGQNAAPGKTLLTIADPTDLFVRVFVPETRIGQVKVAAPATVSTDSLSTRFTGTVSYVASEAEFTPNTVQTAEQRVKLVYEVRVKVSDPSGGLKAGMPVDVSLD
ncbi:RND family efflux transporter MFP subunit [Propionicimonas paludicola]|uniref:RND family efflux transporter MFP subunit n=1 Tax=Propionicimonas paludicola TaxID=185243 RepID=A0A2A9CPL1_9ACTN|nr:efflux RND transporter periplasmic adaptor subunit [Propionicimonas paludicola]PFG16025.1 RND family efflux transporter MFP subunit [Propionicimonas paludicola]